MTTTTENLPNPRVGVAAVIPNAQGKIICGERLGSHGSGMLSCRESRHSKLTPHPGTWQLPGGHLEHGESFFACAERETLEETGLKVRGVKVMSVTNDVFPENKHYITIFVLCEMLEDAEPKVRRRRFMAARQLARSC